MTCRYCTKRSVPHGFNRNGTRRYWCLTCRKTFSESRKTIGNRYLSIETISLIARILTEGGTMSAAARISDVQESTVASLLTEIGEGCEKFLRQRVRGVRISHLEVDEIWAFVWKKQKKLKATDPVEYGDAYTLIALDRDTRLIVT